MKMVFSKRLVLILCAGVFVIAIIGLGAAYLSQVQEQKQLSEKLVSAEKQTAGISTEAILYQQLEEKDRIVEFERKLTVAREKLSVPLVVSDIFQEFLTVAAYTGVRITDINSAALTSVMIAGVPYRTMSIEFLVAGSASNIYSFVDVVSRTFDTGVLKTLKVDIKEDIAGSTSASAANMQLTIYSYEGGYDE